MSEKKPPARGSPSQNSLDETIVERISGRESDNDITFVEEGRPGGMGETLQMDVQAFCGWRVSEAFPARGSEADIFLVEKDGQERILKLYRHGIEPLGEIHERIANLSRTFSEFFVQIFEQGKDDECGRFFELQEFFPLGSLRNLIEKSKLSIPMIRRFLEIASKIIRNLHQNGILHLDLKPENILIRSVDPLSMVVTDFGIASLLEETDSKRISGIKGTSLYQPPESLSGVVGKKSDWWAIGVILLELLAGEHPFEGMQRQVIYYHLTTKGMPLPKELPSDWNSILKGLLTRNPEKRWGESEVEQWLSGKAPRDFYDEEAQPGNLAEVQDFEPLIPHPEWWTKFQIPKNFRGSPFSTLEELVANFISSPKSWDEGKIQFGRGNIVRWLRSNQDFDRADQLFRLLGEGDFVDLALFRLIYQIRPDLTISWAGKNLDRTYLEELLKRAAESDLEGEELLLVENLFKGSILEILQKNKVQIPEKVREILFLAASMTETPMVGFPLPKRASILCTALSDSFLGRLSLDHARRLILRDRESENVFRIAGINGFIPWLREGGLINEDEETLWRVLISVRKTLEGPEGPELLNTLDKTRDSIKNFLRDCGGFLEEIIRFLGDGRASEAAFEIFSENLKQYQGLENFFRSCLKIPADLSIDTFCRRHLLFLKIKNHSYLFREYILPPILQNALDLDSSKTGNHGGSRQVSLKTYGAGLPLDFLKANILEDYDDFISDPGKMAKRGTLAITAWDGVMRFLEEKNIRGFALDRPAKASPSGRFAGTPPSLDGSPERLNLVYSLVEETNRLRIILADDPSSWRRIQNYSISGLVAGFLLVIGDLSVFLGWTVIVASSALLFRAKVNQIREQNLQQAKVDELVNRLQFR